MSSPVWIWDAYTGRHPSNHSSKFFNRSKAAVRDCAPPGPCKRQKNSETGGFIVWSWCWYDLVINGAEIVWGKELSKYGNWCQRLEEIGRPGMGESSESACLSV